MNELEKYKLAFMKRVVGGDKITVLDAYSIGLLDGVDAVLNYMKKNFTEEILKSSIFKNKKGK